MAQENKYRDLDKNVYDLLSVKFDDIYTANMNLESEYDPLILESNRVTKPNTLLILTSYIRTSRRWTQGSVRPTFKVTQDSFRGYLPKFIYAIMSWGTGSNILYGFGHNWFDDIQFDDEMSLFINRTLESSTSGVPVNIRAVFFIVF